MQWKRRDRALHFLTACHLCHWSMTLLRVNALDHRGAVNVPDASARHYQAPLLSGHEPGAVIAHHLLHCNHIVDSNRIAATLCHWAAAWRLFKSV